MKLLEEFLPALPRAVQAAFEFRNPSWFTDEVFNLLKSNNRALCIAETEERTTPDVVTADFSYYRYRKPSYSADERHVMVDRIREHLGAERNVFAYFKHEETPEGALYAVEILKEIYQPRRHGHEDNEDAILLCPQCPPWLTLLVTFQSVR